MFEKRIQKCIRDCCRDLKLSKNVEIQKRLEYLQLRGFDNLPEFYEAFVTNVVLQILHTDEGITEEEVVMFLDEHISYLELMSQSVRIKVCLEDQESKVFREMVVPYAFRLSELAYAVLTTFEADASHLYKVVFGEYEFFGEYQEDSVFEFGGNFANETFLFELELTKGSIIEVNYDYGDNYWFKVEVLELKEQTRPMTIADIEIVDGKGFGIWEDNHALLEVFLDDEEHFPEYVEKEGFELEWFNTDEKFDIVASNETFVENFLYIAGAYNQEDDDDEECC